VVKASSIARAYIRVWFLLLFFSIFFILGLSLSFWGWKPLRQKSLLAAA
jgi:hypothetical protein